MTDFDMSILNDKTLGSVSATPYLDVLAAQQEENIRAKVEGREPLKAVRDVPEYIASESVPSGISPVKLVEREDSEESIEEMLVRIESEDAPVKKTTSRSKK